MIPLVLFAAALSASADGPGPKSHVLTTTELKTTLRGTWIIDADRPYSYCCYPEQFYSHGEYVRHADNFESHGTYRFRNNRVCTKIDRREEVCRQVVVDAKGQYWIEVLRSPQRFKRIVVHTFQ